MVHAPRCCSTPALIEVLSNQIFWSLTNYHDIDHQELNNLIILITNHYVDDHHQHLQCSDMQC